MLVRCFQNTNTDKYKNTNNNLKNDCFGVINSRFIHEKCVNILNEYFLKTYINNEYISLKSQIENILIEKQVQTKVKSLAVVLHGWGANSILYRDIASHVAEENIVLVPDFIGFGGSGEFTQVFNIYDYALHIVKLLSLFEFDKLTLLAHSFGSRVMFALFEMVFNKSEFFQSYLMKYNLSIDELKKIIDKLKVVVIFGGAGVKPRFNLFKKIKILRYKALKKKCKNNKKLTKKLLKYGSNDYKNAKNDNMRKTFLNVVNANTFDKLSKVHLKILCEYFKIKFILIHGKRDKSTPLYMAKKMHKKLYNSQLYVLKKSGHFTFLDQFDDFMKIIECVSFS